MVVWFVWLPTAHAQSQAQVFHSTYDDGNGSCSGLTPCPFVGALNVWALGPEVSCEDESCTVSCGDVCAIDTLVEVEGGTFSRISAEPGLVVQPACVDEGSPCLLPAGTTSVHVVASFAGQAPQSGPRRLIGLELAAGAEENSTAVSVNGVKLVDAGFSAQTLPTAVIALPEPALLSGLLCGLLALSRLRRQTPRTR
jgi:hypothetical protein